MDEQKQTGTQTDCPMTKDPPQLENCPVLNKEAASSEAAGRLNVLFSKNGKFSITRSILIMAWAIALFKYLFAGLTVEQMEKAVEIGASLGKWKIAWQITFNGGDAIAILGAASTLYFANHNISYHNRGSQ